MRINVEKWNSDRIDTETKITCLKEQMRTSGHMVTWDEQRALSDLKFTATCLYQVRAVARGRQHRHKEAYISGGSWFVEEITKEQEVEQIQGWLDQYRLPEPEVAASA